MPAFCNSEEPLRCNQVHEDGVLCTRTLYRETVHQAWRCFRVLQSIEDICRSTLLAKQNPSIPVLTSNAKVALSTWQVCSRNLLAEKQGCLKTTANDRQKGGQVKFNTDRSAPIGARKLFLSQVWTIPPL